MKKKIVELAASCCLPTPQGKFLLYAFRSSKKREHLVLIKGNIKGKEWVFCRVHSSCITGEVFHSSLCQCHEELKKAMKICSLKGRGVIIWLNQEGGGHGIIAKIRQLKLIQEKEVSFEEANRILGFKRIKRSFKEAAEILKELKVKSVKLMTKNQKKIEELRRFGIKVKQFSIRNSKNQQTINNYE